MREPERKGISKRWPLWAFFMGIILQVACEGDLKPSLPEILPPDVVQVDPPAQDSTSFVPPMLKPPTEQNRCQTQSGYVAPNVIRRLTRMEYENTIRELIGVDVAALVSSFPPEEEVNGFDNQSKSLQVSALHVEQYLKAAEELANLVFERMDELSPCIPMNEEAERCVETFIEHFGSRAWRRPLTETESAQFMELYRLGVEGAHQDLQSEEAHVLGEINPIKDGVTLMITALLQSPHFLYRVERGREQLTVYSSPDGEAGRVEGVILSLSDYEVASRLSYLLWRSMPDDILFEAAAAGELRDPDQRLAQAERMLLDPRASDGLWSFFEQWLAIDEVEDISKDNTVFPSYETELNHLMESEIRLFIEDVVFAQKDMRRLFDSPVSFMNNQLAKHYAAGGEGAKLPESRWRESKEWALNTENGLSDDARAEQLSQLPLGESFQEVKLNPERRSGLLTRGAVLSLTTKPNMGDPVHRGLYIRERLLCTPLPPPPPDIVVVAPDPDPTLTTREQFAIHSSEPSCAGCHSLVDPLGFGYERFDPVGRFRETENGKSIDDQGEVIRTLDIDGPYEGSAELASKLATSEQVQRCIVLNVLRFAQGRSETPAEICDVDQVYQRYSESGYDFMILLREVINSPSFSALHFDDPATLSLDELGMNGRTP